MATPLPTLLTFHGSGSNSQVHLIQLARVNRLLKPHFKLHSLCAPFPCPAGPGVLPFFEGCGPYYRWIPHAVPPVRQDTLANAAAGIANADGLDEKVEELVRGEVERVKREGGKVVGVIGFSQGTRVVAGLLKAREAVFGTAGAEGDGGVDDGDVKDRYAWLADIAFGLSVCDSFPPPLVPKGLVPLVQERARAAGEKGGDGGDGGKITLPTLHVLGNQDEWQWAGNLMLENCYHVAEGKSKVLRLDMGHHYPVLPEHTQEIADWVLDAYERTK